MSRHTPGPWKVVNKRVYVDDTDGGFEFDADTEANAQLMALAPEMLSCLEAIVEVYHRPQRQIVPLLEEAMEIIAKAKGEK